MHTHISALAWLYIGTQVLLFLLIWRLVAAHVAARPGFIGELGKAMAVEAA